MSKRTRARRWRHFTRAAMMSWPAHDNPLCRLAACIAYVRAGMRPRRYGLYVPDVAVVADWGDD